MLSSGSSDTDRRINRTRFSEQQTDELNEFLLEIHIHLIVSWLPCQRN